MLSRACANGQVYCCEGAVMGDGDVESFRLDSKWNEADHPRAEDGKFGAGGGSAKSAKVKLSPKEKWAIGSYSGDDFLRVNSALRAGDDSDPAVKHLDSAISKSALQSGQTLYRGMSRDAAKKLFADGHIQVGAEISDKAFASTSKSRGIAEMNSVGGVMLQIEPEEGAKGLDISDRSNNREEQEVLLPRNAKMKVLGIKAPKNPMQPVVVRVEYARADEAKADDDAMGPVPPPPADMTPAEPIRAAGVRLSTPEGLVLFIKRGQGGDYPGHWAFPGGKIEDGETPAEAAARECEEETGFKPEDLGAALCRRVKDGSDFTTFSHKVDAEFIPTLSDESTAYAWAPADQPPEPIHPGCKVALDRPGMNELDVARAMAAGDLTSPQPYVNMALYDMRLTGTGLSYRGALDEHVYRRPEIYQNEDFLARCAGLPVIWVHPPKNTLDSKEFSKRVIGAVMLAYIKGEDVWAICRIYDADAIAEMQANQLSTSPAVVFRNPSENTKLELENGSKLLIEGEPTLLDHLAVVEKGVWDKGGEPSGIRADAQIEDVKMADENEVKEEKKADAGSENIKDLIVGLADSVGKLCSRMDAFEERENAKADAAKADAEGKEAEGKPEDEEDAKAEKIAADKARKDAEEEAEKAKADAATKDARLAELERTVRDLRALAPKPLTDTDYLAMTDAQARADSVFASLGKRSAPRPLDGETPAIYRRRLAGQLKGYSAEWKNIDLAKIDDDTFGVIEAKIYADAATYAAKPDDLGAGELRPVTRTSPTGHTITEFFGRESFVKGMMPPARHVRLADPNARH